MKTSVEAAQNALESAVTEAKCNIPNGVGIVSVFFASVVVVIRYYYHLPICSRKKQSTCNAILL